MAYGRNSWIGQKIGCIITTIIWVEAIITIAIILGYSLYAFRKTDDITVGKKFAAIYDYLDNNNSTSTLGWCLAGGIFWGIFYFAAISAGIYARILVEEYGRRIMICVFMAALNISYHAARWPIFAHIILHYSNISENGNGSSYNITVNNVDKPMIILAFWTDVIVVIAGLILVLIIYMTALGCNNECLCCD